MYYVKLHCGSGWLLVGACMFQTELAQRVINSGVARDGPSR